MVEGDSQLVIKKIKGMYSCNKWRLQEYKKRICDLKEDFRAFNIRLIPKKKNSIVDALATSASALSPMEQTKFGRFLVELVAVPSIPNNITNFQAFQDYQNILKIFLSSQMFKGQIIHTKPDGDKEKGDPNEKEEEIGDDDGIWDLKKKHHPKGDGGIGNNVW